MDDVKGSILEREVETGRTYELNSGIELLEKGGIVQSDSRNCVLIWVPLLKVIRRGVGTVRGGTNVENGVGRSDACFRKKPAKHASTLVSYDSYWPAVGCGYIALLVWKPVDQRAFLSVGFLLARIAEGANVTGHILSSS